MKKKEENLNDCRPTILDQHWLLRSDNEIMCFKEDIKARCANCEHKPTCISILEKLNAGLVTVAHQIANEYRKSIDNNENH